MSVDLVVADVESSVLLSFVLAVVALFVVFVGFVLNWFVGSEVLDCR